MTNPSPASPPPHAPRPRLYLDSLDAVLFFVGLYGLAFVANSLHLSRFAMRFVFMLALVLPAIRHAVAPPSPRVARPRSGVLGVLAALLLVIGMGAGALGGWVMYSGWFGAEPDWNAEIDQIAASAPEITIGTPVSPAERRAGAARIVDEERERYRSAARERGEKGVMIAGVGLALIALGAAIERVRTKPA